MTGVRPDWLAWLAAAASLTAACDSAEILRCPEGARLSTEGADLCIYERAPGREVECPSRAPVRIELTDRVVCAERELDASTLPTALCGDRGCVVRSAFQPANVGASITLDGGSVDVVVGSDGSRTWVIDTDTGAISAYDETDPSGVSPRTVQADGHTTSVVPVVGVPTMGPIGGVAVVWVARLEVPAGVRLYAIGQRPLVVVARDEIVIAGTLSVAADPWAERNAPGPGGFAGGPGPHQDGAGPGGGGGDPTTGPANGPGGTGGSHASAGAIGGDGRAGDAATPSPTYGDERLTPLIGGSGGGAGGSIFLGGHGGGAVQLTAGSLVSVELGATIDAGGGGGRIADNFGGNGGSGSGGGAGGAVLIEAPEVRVAGFIGANGGGGSRGGTSPIAGARGAPDRAPAPEAPADSPNGSGGRGSDAMGVAGAGGASDQGGGGGGGAGRIRIVTASGAERFDVGLLPTVASGISTIGMLTPL